MRMMERIAMGKIHYILPVLLVFFCLFPDNRIIAQTGDVELEKNVNKTTIKIGDPIKFVANRKPTTNPYYKKGLTQNQFNRGLSLAVAMIGSGLVIAKPEIFEKWGAYIQELILSMKRSQVFKVISRML